MVNAMPRLSPWSRLQLVERVLAGRPAAHVAAEMGVSRATAYKWLARFRVEGTHERLEQSSSPLSLGMASGHSPDCAGSALEHRRTVQGLLPPRRQDPRLRCRHRGDRTGSSTSAGPARAARRGRIRDPGSRDADRAHPARRMGSNGRAVDPDRSGEASWRDSHPHAWHHLERVADAKAHARPPVGRKLLRRRATVSRSDPAGRVKTEGLGCVRVHAGPGLAGGPPPLDARRFPTDSLNDSGRRC